MYMLVVTVVREGTRIETGKGGVVVIGAGVVIGTEGIGGAGPVREGEEGGPMGHAGEVGVALGKGYILYYVLVSCNLF